MDNNLWENSNPPGVNPGTNPDSGLREDQRYTVSPRPAARMWNQEPPRYAYSPYQAPQTPSEVPVPEPSAGRGRNGVGVALLLVVCLLISVFGGYLGSQIASIGDTDTDAEGGGVVYQPEENPAGAGGDADANAAVPKEGLSVEGVVDIIKNTVVEIVTEEQSNSYFFQQSVQTGAGSGVIISEDGYIVTCAHVVQGASDIKVTLADGTQYDADIVGTPDDVHDIALLKVEARGLSYAALGNSDALVVGEDAIVIGNPLGSLGGTVTNGIISALEREVTVEGKAMTLMQTNAAVNPGNSGGGIFNGSGELIGIINAKSFGEDVEGIGFAIPINLVDNVVNQLMSAGYVSTPALGIEAMWIGSQAAAAEYGVERFGVYVNSVTPGKGAEAAGLAKDDYILNIEGETIDDLGDISAVLQNYAVGDSVEVQVLRGGQTLTFTLVLSERNA